MGLLTGKFHKFLTELSASDTSGFSFPDNNFNSFSKYQWILIKLAMCIGIVEICFGNSNGQISSIFYSVMYPGYEGGSVLSFYIFIK